MLGLSCCWSRSISTATARLLHAHAVHARTVPHRKAQQSSGSKKGPGNQSSSSSGQPSSSGSSNQPSGQNVSQASIDDLRADFRQGMAELRQGIAQAVQLAIAAEAEKRELAIAQAVQLAIAAEAEKRELAIAAEAEKRELAIAAEAEKRELAIAAEAEKRELAIAAEAEKRELAIAAEAKQRARQLARGVVPRVLTVAGLIQAIVCEKPALSHPTTKASTWWAKAQQRDQVAKLVGCEPEELDAALVLRIKQHPASVSDIDAEVLFLQPHVAVLQELLQEGGDTYVQSMQQGLHGASCLVAGYSLLKATFPQQFKTVKAGPAKAAKPGS